MAENIKKMHDGFCRRLKELRSALNLSQDVFSSELHIPKATYVRYESGKILPRLPFLTAIGIKYNVNIDWLTFGRGRMFLDKDFLEAIKILDRLHVLDHAEFAELMSLLEIPPIKRAIMVELEKLKHIFKQTIAETLKNKKEEDS